jgi:hypothetical protein
MPVCRSASSRRRRRRLCAALTALLLGAAVTACGTTASPSPSPSPSASAGSRPLTGTPRQAAAEYWRLVDANDFAGALAASVPGTRTDMTAVPDDIEHVRLVSARAPRGQGGDAVQLEATVYVEPAAGATPWGEAGEHTLFMQLQKAPSGGWLVRGWGTGP